MDIQYFAYYSLSIIAIICNAVLAFQIWQRRPNKGITTFLILLGATSIWVMTNAFELSATTLVTKLRFAQTSYFGIVLVAPAWFVFTLIYTNRNHWLTPRNLSLLAIQPIIILLLVFTNSSHQLYWSDITLTTDSGYSIAQYSRGTLFWLNLTYTYALLIFSTILLVRTFWRVRGLYRTQILLLLIAQFAPWLGNLLYLLNRTLIPDHMDTTSIGFAFTSMIAGWTFLRFRLIDAMPVARDIVFDNIDDAVFVMNPKNQIVDLNPAGTNLIGKPSEEIIGEYIADVFTEQSDFFEQYPTTERVNAEIKIEDNEITRWYQLKITPLNGSTGEALGSVAILQNITQSKQMEQSIKEAHDEAVKARTVAEEHSRLKTEFLANMSHELRTPLHAIHGYTSILLEGIDMDLSEKTHRMIERVDTNSQYLIGLIDDILNISRIEAGRFELTLQTIVMANMIQRWQSSITVLAEKKGLHFSIKQSPDFPARIVADEVALHKIIMNLLSNAIKFTHTGHVELSLEVSDEHWLFKVSDTGIGIAEDARELIFEEFRQVDGSTTREYGGTGLGLALAQKLTIAHGGHIDLISEVNIGSTFIVHLPRQLVAKTTQPNIS